MRVGTKATCGLGLLMVEVPRKRGDWNSLRRKSAILGVGGVLLGAFKYSGREGTVVPTRGGGEEGCK